MTMPVNDAFDAGCARIELVLHGVWKSRQHDSTESTMHHGKSLGVLRTFAKGLIDDHQEVRSRLW